MQWFAQAPSNIALIKYMGKKDAATNNPANPSLSYTLHDLLSNVELEQYSGKKDLWEPLQIPGLEPVALSEAAQARYLAHLKRLKDLFQYNGAFIVRSANNFPQGTGLASSASSFAALTKCTLLALCELQEREALSPLEMARLSQRGSGSSCRSFFSPWALWESNNEVHALNLPYTELLHQVILIDHAPKKVSSSEAHRLVMTSPQYDGRPDRAIANLKALKLALEAEDWASAHLICWHEFKDMHQLFSTCEQPFTYMTPDTELVLHQLQDLWQREGDGPLVTMDAGPNIHLLYRPDQHDMALEFKKDYLVGNYDVL